MAETTETLIETFGPWMRPGESPEQCLVRHIHEASAANRLLADCTAQRDKAEAASREAQGWQPIATAPPGLADGKWTYVLFSGYSKGRSFAGRVVVSGWMGKTHDGRYEPVHNYCYKLVITHWAPLPSPPETAHD